MMNRRSLMLATAFAALLTMTVDGYAKDDGGGGSGGSGGSGSSGGSGGSGSGSGGSGSGSNGSGGSGSSGGDDGNDGDDDDRDDDDNSGSGNSGKGKRRDSDDATRAVNNGQAVSIRKLKRHLDANYPGKILKLDLKSQSDGLVYRIKILQADNRVKSLSLDAKTLQKR